MKEQIAYLLVAATMVLPGAFTTGCSVTHHQESVSSYEKDKEIVARIKTALYADPAVKGSEVKVTSLDGVVQLSGFVQSQEAKQRAAQIAAAVPGVVKVYNNLILPSGR